MERALAVLSNDEPDADLATLAAELGRLYFFKGEVELAAERIDVAIEIAETLWLPETLSQALNTQGLITLWGGRPEQSLALLKRALDLALENDLSAAALRAYNNLGDWLDRRDRYEEAIALDRQAVALARKAGDRIQEWRLLGELSWYLGRAGQWDDALETAAEVPDENLHMVLSAVSARIEIAVGRGDPGEARRVFGEMSAHEGSADVQEQSSYASMNATILRAEGRYEEALSSAQKALAVLRQLWSGISVDVKIALGEALESAFALGRFETVEELIGMTEAYPPGTKPPSLVALAARFRAKLAAARGEHDGVEQGFKTAAAILLEHGLPFHLAVVQLEHGEWLAGRGRAQEAEPLVGEARLIFERLGAAPWLARCDRLAHGAIAV
jgi:tetratricopeptide (TPR) repeat protein